MGNNFKYYVPSRRGTWTLLLLLLVGMLAGALLSSLMGMLCGLDFTGKYGMLITYPLQFVPAMVFAARNGRKYREAGSTGTSLDNEELPFARFAPAAILATISAAVVVEPLMMLLPEMPESIKQAMEMLSKGPLWSSLLTTAVFAPICEEWLCRGMILRGLLRRANPATAIMLSSLAFALIHLNPWQAVPAFLLGCLFGLVYYKTGSLKLTMLMHAANNAMSVLLGQCPATKDCDYIYQIFNDKSSYILFFSVCLCIVAAYITQLLRKSHNFKSSN